MRCRDSVRAAWHEVKYDIKACRQLADSRSFDCEKVDDNVHVALGVTNAVEDEVASVSWMASDVASRGELVPPFEPDGKVNVRRAPGIRNGLDSAEITRTSQIPSFENDVHKDSDYAIETYAP